ncbi:cytochrome P450 [Kibdelosporangium aridum]|uniref:Cytochrome P450 n=1 Tax=Kibdelosporangium aridum TaxID=2030 RepID=A0A1W2FYY2_KIBAR|nr:cytochrome P450 [Kibdelosporangium aridum]SMD26922.1 Cytochrome P450 [Kibdelosporangium aridum]
MSASALESGALSDVDLTDPVTYLRPDLDDIWQRLRQEQPVVWHPGGGFWVVTPHRLVTGVYRDNSVFTSTEGNVLATLLGGGDSAGGRMLAVSDGERHRRVRRELMSAFTPAALASVERNVVAGTRHLVRTAVARGTCDFATEVAEHIPLAAICDLLDVPAADRDTLLSHTSSALSSAAPDATDLQARLARNEILLYFAKLAAKRRRAAPADDVIGLLVRMTEPPLSLSDDEVLLNCYSLLLGGDETARLSMIGAVKALAEHQEIWQALRGGRVDLARAVEEVLRWTTPAMHSGRTVVVDTEIAGVAVRRGQVVTVWPRSANFDEAEFATPHRLDFDRSPNRHLSFAYGPHFCLGAQLARIEIGALLSALTEFADEIVLDGAPKPIFSTFLSGYSSLPVRFVPRSQGSTT